jgi:IS30 family transposase
VQRTPQQLVDTKLRLGWSPEQIGGRLRRERGIRPTHETTYPHLIPRPRPRAPSYFASATAT